MTPDAWPDLAGRLVMQEGRQRHVLPVRVYFEDTDAGGIAYHASFVRWCERGRTDFLRLLGTDARRLIDGTESQEPAGFIVRRMTFDFSRPARMDDSLEVWTHLVELGGASVKLAQQITRGGQRLCEADVIVVLVSVAGKPLRLSETIRAAMGGGPGQ
jgi:acyl-CoA thioester hydrolase